MLSLFTQHPVKVFYTDVTRLARNCLTTAVVPDSSPALLLSFSFNISILPRLPFKLNSCPSLTIRMKCCPSLTAKPNSCLCLVPQTPIPVQFFSSSQSFAPVLLSNSQFLSQCFPQTAHVSAQVLSSNLNVSPISPQTQILPYFPTKPKSCLGLIPKPIFCHSFTSEPNPRLSLTIRPKSCPSLK